MLSTTKNVLQKKIRNTNYLSFIFKKRTFKSSCIFAVYPVGVKYPITHRRYTIHKKFINITYK